jgi:hypothetical protein
VIVRSSIDLNKYPLRGLEQAGHLFKKPIKPMIEGKIDAGSSRVPTGDSYRRWLGAANLLYERMAG